jgi:epoxyqueuosine reductase QueG
MAAKLTRKKGLVSICPFCVSWFFTAEQPFREGGAMKEKIRDFALGLGVDDVGVANASDYKSPMSPPLESLLPGAKSIVVLAYRELSTCDSPSMQVAMNGRMDLMEFSRGANYRMARFIERETGTKTVTIGVSYPMEMTERTGGAVGEVSLRHAAVAAGLGAFGKNNLVLHPELGSRVIFTAVVTQLDLPSDAPAERVCTDCGLCVESCPGKALDVEGKTNVGRCLRNSQPYGIGGSIQFWTKMSDATPEEQKAMLKDSNYWRLYQASMIGFQYFCWNCLKTCPVGVK